MQISLIMLIGLLAKNAFLQATGFVNDHLTGCRCKGGRQQTAP